MNIISVLAFCTLLLFIQATDLNEGYYVGFIDTLGIDTHVTDDGVDCTEPASKALSQFRDAIVHGHKDTENVLQAVADIIDRLKFEVSPQCRTFYGEFLDFMDIYYGDAEEIKSIADRNLKEHNEMIEKVVNDSRNALVSGDDYGVGKGHANVLKLLLDLEKAEVVVEKTIETAQEILEIAKEEIVKLGQTVNETVEKVVEIMAKEEDAPAEEEVLIWTQDMVKKEEPVHVHEVKEQVPVQEDMKNDSASFNEQMDYEYFDIVGAAEVQHEEGEDEYEDGVVEEESLLTEDLSDKEEIGAPVDLKHYPEDDQEEEEEEKEEEEEEEEEDYLTDDDVVKVELEEQKRQQDDQDDSTDQSTDDSTDDYDAYLSQYDDEVVEIQRRVLSQDYHYNYDL